MSAISNIRLRFVNLPGDPEEKKQIPASAEFNAVVLNWPEEMGGGVTPAAAQADSTATEISDLVADFNALLAKLRTAGLMEDE